MHTIKKSTLSLISILILSYALYAIKTCWLAFANGYMPLFALAMNIPLLLSFLLGIIYAIYYNPYIKKNFCLIILPFINLFFHLLRFSSLSSYPQFFFTFIICFLFVFFPSVYKSKIFNCFYWIIQICNLISVLFYLCYILHINLGFKEVPYYAIQSQPNALYIKWFIFAIYKNGLSLRLCSIFNEPGALGTVCSLVFVARYNYCKTWEKILLLITILCSVSLAGLIIVLGFYFFIFLKKNVFLCIFLFLIIIGIGAYIVTTSEGQLAVLILRLITGENNRTTDAFDKVYENFKASSNFWFGMNISQDVLGSVSSIKTFIINYGIIGTGIWLITWLFAALKMSDKRCFLFILFFFVSLYQRPALIQSIYGYVLLFGGIEWIMEQKENVKCR